MRRHPVLLGLLSFLLGGALTWLAIRSAAAVALTQAPPEPEGEGGPEDEDPPAWFEEAPTGRLPALDPEEVTRVSGTLDDLLAEPHRWEATVVAEGPHPHSALPLPDGGAPSDEYTVKGIVDRFHTTESPHYPRVRAEVWFRTEADAERAGFMRWDQR